MANPMYAGRDTFGSQVPKWQETSLLRELPNMSVVPFCFLFEIQMTKLEHVSSTCCCTSVKLVRTVSSSWTAADISSTPPRVIGDYFVSSPSSVSDSCISDNTPVKFDLVWLWNTADGLLVMMTRVADVCPSSETRYWKYKTLNFKKREQVAEMYCCTIFRHLAVVLLREKTSQDAAV